MIGVWGGGADEAQRKGTASGGVGVTGGEAALVLGSSRRLGSWTTGSLQLTLD